MTRPRGFTRVRLDVHLPIVFQLLIQRSPTIPFERKHQDREINFQNNSHINSQDKSHIVA